LAAALSGTDHLGSVEALVALAEAAVQLALASTDHLGSVVRALAGLDLLEAVEVQEMVQMTALG
tara:strand:+ start:345 stop:536 length:192 start_codon:yes stop_codon:yes gene_type:complete